MEARWTPDENAGSARFSKRYRDGEGEDYEQYLSDTQRAILWLERATGAPAWALCVAALLFLVACRLALRLWAHVVSRWSARRLLAEEESDSRQRAAAAALQRAEATTPADDDGGVRRRFCRFCDVEVADNFVDSHPSGKKHLKVIKKLGEMQHVKFALDDWEDWRRVVSVSLEAAPAVEEEELVVVDTTSKGGKWAKAGGGPKRRR